MATPERLIEARASGFGAHRLSRLLKRDDDTKLSLFTVEHADEVTNVAHLHLASLDAHNDLLGFRPLVEEEEASVDAVVRPLLPFSRSRPNKP